MGMLKEFRDFAVRGNVVDMAVAFIMGGAFGKIVSTLVEKVLMPPLGAVAGKVDFKDLAWELVPKSGDQPAVLIAYGEFINAIINFTIVAFALFLIIKATNRLKRQEAQAPTAPPEQPMEVKLLTEIRDTLQGNKLI
jgi:large conductance mechanosensitive channel